MYNKEKNITSKSEYYLYTASETAKQLFIYPTVIGKFDYLAGYNLVRNHYDSYLLLFIEKGNMEILLENNLLSAHSGDVVLINCYYPHQYRAVSDCSTLWLHFDGAFSGNYFNYIIQQSGNVITPYNFRNMYQQLFQLFTRFKASRIPNEPTMSLTIIGLLQGLMESAAASAPASDGIKKATSFIADNFKSKISVNEIASIAGFSPYYFTRIFKKETGLTPHQYLLSTRISAAKYNLSTTQMSISEIAGSCGFDDDSAFCYAFKKFEGMTPGEFRSIRKK